MKSFGELKKGDKIYLVEKLKNKKGEKKVNIQHRTVVSSERCRSIFGDLDITLDKGFDVDSGLKVCQYKNVYTTNSRDVIDIRSAHTYGVEVFSDEILMMRFLELEYGFIGTTQVRNKFNKVMRETGSVVRWNFTN